MTYTMFVLILVILIGDAGLHRWLLRCRDQYHGSAIALIERNHKKQLNERTSSAR